MKEFVVINFSECFTSTREKFFSKLSEEQNLQKVAELLQIFLAIPEKVEKYAKMRQSSSSDEYVHCYNVETLKFFDPNCNWLILNS